MNQLKSKVLNLLISLEYELTGMCIEMLCFSFMYIICLGKIEIHVYFVLLRKNL